MIKPAVLDAMVAAGCTAEQIAAVVKADQQSSSGAARQARYRARKASQSDECAVTSVTVTDTVSPKKEIPPTPPKEKTTPSATLLSRDPLQGREPELLDALGVTDETKTPALLVISEPIRWVEGGCDIDLDIIPTLRSIRARGKPVRGWGYCTDAVFEARDRRLAPIPAVQPRQATGPPEQARKPRNAGEAARLELIRRGEYPDASNTSARRDDQGDGNAGFAGTDIARRIAIASSG